MRASVFYRAAAVLLLLFAAGHTWGFRQVEPTWHIDALVQSMKTLRFNADGFSRTYWDFFVAAGFLVGAFYLFAAVLAWQMGRLSADALAEVRPIAWAFALCFAVITAVSWGYLFILPIAFSAAITVCLAAAAWLSPKTH